MYLLQTTKTAVIQKLTKTRCMLCRSSKSKFHTVIKIVTSYPRLLNKTEARNSCD